MAARTFRAPAITPDTRHHCEVAAGGTRTVSFTALKTPTAALGGGANGGSATMLHGTTSNDGDNEATLRQYSLYRSAPDQFPSYERMRFVR
eukprot:CAMPEP_0201930434 /NCGR_PEP_ID=MMETSP0903-20130614/25146_1 /ASSEMBLY_ACC=CAM_ASM_000552 /TAXON_ID=420261 /ORGANISM="Thalassiosira antarctica, Strain CCMP982" /LENGTH=90 /DNA_ID=CAMNT_0048469497 /DNA_START=113 /DNA_END=381 /DNA_ORIENTATION=-